MKALQFWTGEAFADVSAEELAGMVRDVQRIAEEAVKLGALHTVFGFAWHHITCLYVRCRRRASSARPRFILDFTVPSGTFSIVAISL